MRQNLKILIVEDEAIFAMSMQRVLTRSDNNTCELVSTGEAAVESAKREKPDVIIMDIFLDGKLNGIEAAMEIRSLYEIPIVFVTGYEEGKILDQIKSVESSTYLIKPIIPDDLKSAIDRVLKK
jgi:CheY-like chemotaxis protein